METKEELRQRFYDDLGIVGGSFPEESFNFFWKEIEAVRNTYNALDKAHQTASDQIQQLRAKISRLEATLEAADEVITAWTEHALQNYRYDNERSERLAEALEKYNQLKAKK